MSVRNAVRVSIIDWEDSRMQREEVNDGVLLSEEDIGTAKLVIKITKDGIYASDTGKDGPYKAIDISLLKAIESKS